MKLNIGCGHKIMDGYVNIDYPSNWSGVKPDIAADVRSLPLGDDVADEAMAIHVLEHIWYWQAEDTLREWVRVLKPGGRLVLEMPCLDKVIAHFVQGSSPAKTWFALYGDPKHKSEEMTHKWCYSISMIRDMLGAIGLEQIEYSEPVYHFQNRDMRMTAIKPKRRDS